MAPTGGNTPLPKKRIETKVGFKKRKRKRHGREHCLTLSQ